MNKYFRTVFINAFIFISACSLLVKSNPENIDYKQEMRDFVHEISIYSKDLDSDFIIISQNGVELVTINGEETGTPETTYLNSIDGIGQEDLLYGYDNNDQASSSTTINYITTFLNIAKDNGIQILVTDYCSTHSKVDDSYQKNDLNGFISFAANHRELGIVPDYPNPIYNENSGVITNLSATKNFLYLINPSDFSSKHKFIEAVVATNYDLIILDYFFNDEEFTPTELNQLRSKNNGGKRLVISYLSIGEAEDYRYYWQSSWKNNPPEWLDKENPDWEGNYKVKFWYQDWKNVIYGSNDAYLDKILNVGFDGVYLDIIDAFEYFEN